MSYYQGDLRQVLNTGQLIHWEQNKHASLLTLPHAASRRERDGWTALTARTRLFIFQHYTLVAFSLFSCSALDIKCWNSCSSSKAYLTPSFHPITHFQLYHFLCCGKTKWPLSWCFFARAQETLWQFHFIDLKLATAVLARAEQTGLRAFSTWQDSSQNVFHVPTRFQSGDTTEEMSENEVRTTNSWVGINYTGKASLNKTSSGKASGRANPYRV